MNDACSQPTPGPVEPSPFDRVVEFFEMVFTGSADEDTERKEKIRQLIMRSFHSDYTFNGQKMAPAALFQWREALLEKFPQMVFRVNNAISAPVDLGTKEAATGVCISWTVHVVDTSGQKLDLRGMNLLAITAGQALSNVQLGDAEKGWHPVSGS